MPPQVLATVRSKAVVLLLFIHCLLLLLLFVEYLWLVRVLLYSTMFWSNIAGGESFNCLRVSIL